MTPLRTYSYNLYKLYDETRNSPLGFILTLYLEPFKQDHLRSLQDRCVSRARKTLFFLYSVKKLFAYDSKTLVLGGPNLCTLTRLPSSRELQHSIGPVAILRDSASRLRLVCPF